MKASVNRSRAYLHKLSNDIQSDWTEFKREFMADWDRIPNLFTEARLICSPIPGLLMLSDPNSVMWLWAATIMFAIVAATDKIDGYLARRLNQVTRLGEALDPVVDKVLISLTLIAIIMTSPLDWIKLPMFIIVGCEIVVVWLSFRAKHQETAVAVTYFGKVKMFMQCVAIIIISMPIKCSPLFYLVTVAFMVAITFISLVIYLRRFHVWRKSVG